MASGHAHGFGRADQTLLSKVLLPHLYYRPIEYHESNNLRNPRYTPLSFLVRYEMNRFRCGMLVVDTRIVKLFIMR